MAQLAITRIKRATRELLGLRTWPKREEVRPRTFEEHIYAAAVQEGDICFDVGANLGAVSLLLARLAGEAGRVVAFEPLWPVFSRLCATIQADRYWKADIVPVPLGLADTEKSASLQVPARNFGMGSLAAPETWSAAHNTSHLTAYPCNFVGLDAFLASTGQLPPTFMKIDVEGAELLVLQGARRMFREGHRPLMLVEVFAPWERALGYGPWEVLSYLGQLGYRFLFVCARGLVKHTPTPSEPFPMEYETGYNILAFVPQRHGDRIRRLRRYRVGGDAHIPPMAPPPIPNRLSHDVGTRIAA